MENQLKCIFTWNAFHCVIFENAQNSFELIFSSLKYWVQFLNVSM